MLFIVDNIIAYNVQSAKDNLPLIVLDGVEIDIFTAIFTFRSWTSSGVDSSDIDGAFGVGSLDDCTEISWEVLLDM